MSTISPQILDEFWEVCNSTYTTWLARRSLFEDNPEIETLRGTHCGPFLDHLNEVTQLHVLGQIARLHDPAAQFGHTNLSIGFVMQSGNWDKETAMILSGLKAKLDAFAMQLQVLRNKLLAHNDHATFRSRRTLGAFPLNADVEYFANLQKFIDIIEGEPNPFDDLIKNDALAFIDALIRGANLSQ